MICDKCNWKNVGELVIWNGCQNKKCDGVKKMDDKDKIKALERIQEINQTQDELYEERVSLLKLLGLK